MPYYVREMTATALSEPAETPVASCWARQLRRSALIATTLAISAAIAGCGTTARSTTEAPASAPPPAACPPGPPAAPSAEQWSTARHALAPPGAGAIRLCRYSGLNAHPRLARVGSRLLSGHTIVQQVVTEFDRLPSLRGAVACPADDGSQILALLAYPDGHHVSISVGLSGCALVTNGSVRRTAAGLGTPRAFGPQLLALLEQLLSTHRQSNAGSANALAHDHWSVLAPGTLTRGMGPRTESTETHRRCTRRLEG